MANGNFAGGDGTLENPYLIEDAFDLDAVRNNLSASYKLISDIDLNISPFNEGEGWIPIGDNSTSSNDSRFTGSFDGNNKIIFNLFINRPSSNWQGLFGYTNGSTIKNIGIENIDITGGSYTGGLVGINSNSSVVNSYSTGSLTGGNNTGGLVGLNSNLSVVRNSYSTGIVTGDSNTGGLVGRNNVSSVVENSYSTGSVTGSIYTGGLVGYNNNSSVVNSYSTGSVTGGGYTGGLVGYNYNSSVIENSYSTGNVTGGGGTGGLVGYNYSSSVIENSYSTGSVTGNSNTGGLVGRNSDSSVIRNSYSTGLVNEGSYTGGLVGVNNNSSVVENSYWDKETSGYTSSAGGIGLTTQEMQTAQTFIDAGWGEETLENGNTIWILNDGEYPILWFERESVYHSSGYYESPVLDLGERFGQFKKIEQIMDKPNKTGVEILTSTSSDGVNFSDYISVNPDGTILSPSSRYIKIRIELRGDGERGELTPYDFSDSAQFEENKYLEFEDSLKVKVKYTNDMSIDQSIEEGILLRTSLKKNEFKKIEKMEVI